MEHFSELDPRDLRSIQDLVVGFLAVKVLVDTLQTGRAWIFRGRNDRKKEVIEGSEQSASHGSEPYRSNRRAIVQSLPSDIAASQRR
jgi:hypothetical protein